jgi:hypothetical protein
MTETPASVLWKHRWAPAREWGALVLSLEFRQDAVRSFFNVYSNSRCNVLSYNAPLPSNCCPFCVNWRHQECFFFHPTLAAIFLTEIEAYNHMRYRCHDEYLNSELLERLFKILPVHYAQLGYPCPNGFLWGCVVDKLEQTFPREVFMMLDIRNMLQKKEVQDQLYIRLDYIKEREAASKEASSSPHKSFSQHMGEYQEYVPVSTHTEPTCGCKFYYEGNCPVYEAFINGKAIHPSSSQYADIKTNKLSFGKYVDTVKDEFDEDWERAPVCSQLRLRAFLQREYLKRITENKANEARLNAAKKESSAKYKNSKLRSGKPSLALLP